MTSTGADQLDDRDQAARQPRPRALRIALGLLYLVAALVYGVYEWNAHAILDRADRLDVSGKHLTAATAYGLVLDKYPLSVTVIAARRGLDRVGVASGDFSNPTPVPGSHAVRPQVLDARATDPLPLIGLPMATVILALAFATRIRRRPGLAAGIMMLGAATAYMSLSLLVRDGMLNAEWLQPTARMYRETPVLPYLATYVFVTLACLSTLTRRGEPKPARTPSPAAAEAAQPEVIRVAAFVAGTSASAPTPSSSCDAIDSPLSVEVDAESPDDAVGREATTERGEMRTSELVVTAINSGALPPPDIDSHALEVPPAVASVSEHSGTTAGTARVHTDGEFAMIVEKSLIRRVALSLSVLAAVIVGGIFYGGYDARAAAAHRSAQTGIDHAKIVVGHPLTVAARASAQAIGISADRESVRSQLGGDANLLGFLTMIDWFGLLLAGCVAIASLALRYRLQSKWPRRACRGLLLMSVVYAGVMIINSVVGRILPTWLGDALGWLENVGFHAVAGFALSLVMAIVLWPWRGLTNRTAVRLGRMQPDWRPLWDIFDRVGGATWETRALAVASRVITHVAVFAAVLWVPLNIWHRTLPRLAGETPSSTGVAATGSFLGTAAGPTIWADFAGVLIAVIAAYAARILVLAVRESRAGRPPEPLILRHMLFLPVLAIAHRLVADLAATGLSGNLSTHPLVIYAGATLGLMCGIWVYYQCIVLGVNVKKTVRNARDLVTHVREWASQPRNRLRATLHGIALVFLLILMIGANSRAPFQRLVPAFNPTRITLDGPAALVSLETRVLGDTGDQGADSTPGEWRAATPGRVIDDAKASKATSLEIGVFWLAFGFGYVAEILMALVVTVVYFAACVAIVAPAMLIAAAVVAVAQALALVLDTVLLVVAMVTGWNAGFASAWLWGDVLGPAFDFIAANLGRVRLWGLLENFRGLGFQFGARLIIALPSFILVGLVLVLVYRWRARRLAAPSTGTAAELATAIEIKPVLVGHPIGTADSVSDNGVVAVTHAEVGNGTHDTIDQRSFEGRTTTPHV